MYPMTHAASATTHDGGWSEILPRVPARLERGNFRFSQIGLLIVPVLATILRVASKPTSALAYVVLAGWALTGRRQAILSLFFCWLFNMISHVFCGSPLYAAQLRFVIFFAAAFSVLLHGPSRTSTTKVGSLAAATITVLVLIVGHSMVASLITDVSVLKSVTFSVVFMTVLCGWGWMAPAERHLTIQTIFGSLMLVVLFGLPMRLAGRGTMGFSAFFCGVIYHSQTMGMIAATVAAALMAQCLTIRPLRWWRVLLLGLALIELYWTGSRASAVALAGGVGLAFIVQLFGSVLFVRGENPRIVAARLGVAGLLFLLLLIVAGRQIGGGLRKFLLKYGEKEDVSLLEQGMSTRQELIDTMSENIRRHPLSGIGFGVGSTPQRRQNIVRDPYFGLPIMATVEKGVLPFVILEEFGIPLGVMVFFWIGLLVLCASRGGIVPFAVFLTSMLTNLAESSFFSPGGVGLLAIILTGWAVTEPAGGAWKKHLRDRQVALARRSSAGAPLSPVFVPPSLPAPPSRPLLPAPSPLAPTAS
jgi:hypothetical protein